MDAMRTGLTPDQYQYLLNPLRSTRVATRSQGGKQLSYLESWDVRAHLNRIFGFTGWDLEMLSCQPLGVREYANQGKDMVEAIWQATMRLKVKSADGYVIATYTESAVGSTSGPANMLGEHHDNALKTAASDALKRCAINLGTQFGLSLYNNGSKADVVRQTLVKPKGVAEPDQPSGEKQEALEQSVGVTPTGEHTSEAVATEATEGGGPE